MGFIEFLNTLEETLNTIEVKGYPNISAMHASLEAINSMRNSIYASIQQETAKQEDKPVGGGEVGRQSDIGTDSSITDRAE